MDSRDIIAGVGLIRESVWHYNNPSFGYGGYCLARGHQAAAGQLRGSAVQAFDPRCSSKPTGRAKTSVAEQILAREPEVVGIHRLVMKDGSDNHRPRACRGS